MIFIRALALLIMAIFGISLLAGLTPWLINERGTLGLVAVPFVWLGFAALVTLVYRNIMKNKHQN